MRLTKASWNCKWYQRALDDPEYLYMHHGNMRVKWHQYIECTSMRFLTDNYHYEQHDDTSSRPCC
uniref:Late blight resistance protein n=1 Tax=Solanum demissum TaxID=50514 RepID=Q0KIU1_SOLDE|nr:hypothetical protein SDM1_25t00013 [Solanum demissum]